MGKWAPPLKRSRMLSFNYAGSQIGTVASLLLSGVLAEHLGWESVFYFFGTSSISWHIFWLCFAFDSPNNHPRITEDERLYIIRTFHRSSSGGGRIAATMFFTSLPGLRRVFAGSSPGLRRVLAGSSPGLSLCRQLLPAVWLIALAHIGCNFYEALLTLAVGLDGISMSGFQANHVDLSLTHAGILKGISNTFGTIPGMIGP
ncbi:putative Sialin [Hypsibius exemplaris]|uniref:Sialin n=1 Tax=Hypsibius exemplaris TaxID=2072580 RepID=A0A1W0WGW9_HYPEX|nr:putative Sialin [Hypsibius exemplaris]